MSALSIQPTYPIFTDIDGQPLDDGFVWVGAANLDPQENPVAVFWDSALTLPVVQPIRTLAGYPSNSGTPSRLYVNSDYSIRLMNKIGSVVYSSPSPTERYGNVISLSVIEFLQSGIGATPRTSLAKLQEAVSVKDFGAIGDGLVDDTTSIQAALDARKYVSIPPGTYNISASIKPNNGQRLFFEGGRLFTTGIIVTDECAIKVVNVSDVEIWNPDVDCDNQPANSGLIVRENTADIRIYNVKVVNAAWDAARGGGRAVTIESNTGTVGKIIVDGLTGTNTDTLIGLNGYHGSRKNAVIVTNAIGFNVNKLIAIFGNGGADPYPHTGDAQQFLISNVVGYNVSKPIRFDRAGNTIIDNVYVYNSPAYGATDTVIRGTASNVRCTNIVMEGDVNSLYDGTPWSDSNAGTDLGFDTLKCHFGITHRGTASLAALTAGITRATLVSNTMFDLNTDVITTNLVSNIQMRVNTSAYVELYSCAHNARVTGLVSKIGPTLISAFSGANNGLFLTSPLAPTAVGSTSAGAATYGVQSGSYTRIGNLVFFQLYLSWTGHTGTGSMWIEGLPTSSGSANSQSAASVSFVNNLTTTASSVVTAYKDAGNGRIILNQYPIGGGAVAGIPMDAEGAVMVSGNYLVD